MPNQVTFAVFFGLVITRRKTSLMINSITQIASFIQLFLHALVVFPSPKFSTTKFINMLTDRLQCLSDALGRIIRTKKRKPRDKTAYLNTVPNEIIDRVSFFLDGPYKAALTVICSKLYLSLRDDLAKMPAWESTEWAPATEARRLLYFKRQQLQLLLHPTHASPDPKSRVDCTRTRHLSHQPSDVSWRHNKVLISSLL
jgi:hypothetical protein